VAVDAVGAGVVIDKMNDQTWRRPDLPMIGRLLKGLGICHLLNGLTGTPTVAVSSVHLGMAHATGVAARRAGALAGLLLMALAFLPAVTTFMAQIPKPVIGAILLYTAAYMMVSGAELILSRLLNARRRATVGLSLVAGAAVFMVPELTDSLPLALRPILGSGLVIGVCCAMLLNLIFHIGVARQDTCILDTPHPEDQASRFLEDRGADWGARREVILRAGLVVGEALEVLRHAGAITGPALLEARFDEDTLTLTLDYPGQALRLEAEHPAEAWALLDQDETAIDQAMVRISGILIRNLADRIDTRSRRGRGQLRLRFNH
jgi:xanthine permease XanP